MNIWKKASTLRRQRFAAALLIGLPVFVPAAQAQEKLRIGAALALTGGLADEGKKQQAAYELWLERVNVAGAILHNGKKTPVELVFYEYQTDEKKARQLAVLGRDDVFPKIMATSMAGQAQKSGLEVVYNQLYPVGTLDHAAALTQLKAAAPIPADMQQAQFKAISR